MPHQRLLLYVISALTDFSAFIVVFVASRSLAEANADPMYLGLLGGSLALVQGIGSLLGGWLSHRFDARRVFVAGAALNVVSIVLCRYVSPASLWFLPAYWLIGIALGCLYPPLIGWLNEGNDPHQNRSGVSRTLFLFCVAWNIGMVCGVLTAGRLFAEGRTVALMASLAVAVLNLALAVFTALRRPKVDDVVEASLDSEPTPVEQIERANRFRRLSWLANLGGMFGGSLVVHLLPDLAVHLNIPSEDHGRILALWRVVVIATYALMYASSFWHFRIGTSIVSQLLAAGGLVVISQAQSETMLMVGLTMLGQLVGYNYFSGLFYSTAGSPPAKRALAAGIHEATLALGMAAGTLLGGVLGSRINHRIPYLLAGVFTVVLLGLQIVSNWVWSRPTARTESLDLARSPQREQGRVEAALDVATESAPLVPSPLD
jgi:MFS family permease